MTKEIETQLRRLVLRDSIRGQTHWDHNHRQLANLITWTTALSNSMNLGHAVRGHPWWMAWWRGLTECGPLENGNGKPLQYSCLENPMNSMKRQKDRTLKDELPRSVGAQYATGDQCRNNSKKNERMEPKQKTNKKTKNTFLCMGLGIEARSKAVKSNIA